MANVLAKVEGDERYGVVEEITCLRLGLVLLDGLYSPLVDLRVQELANYNVLVLRHVVKVGSIAYIRVDCGLIP